MFEARRSANFRELTFKLLAGVAGLYLATSGANAQFASDIDLSTLDGTTGFRLDGAVANGRSGTSVSAAGDVNGDGFGDLIIGAPLVDTNGAAAGVGQGASYVVFGKASGFASAANLSALVGTTGFRLDGDADAGNSGRSVASAGDINNDGFADLIVGAPFADTVGSNSGVSYVVFGKASAFASAIALSALNGTTGFRVDSPAAGEQVGISVSSAGDMNGDGFGDIVIGARFADNNGNSSGSAYVMFGKAGGFASAVNLSSLNGGTGFRLDGVAAGDRTGQSVSHAGDVNGDGLSDLIIGAHIADTNGATAGTEQGASYVVFGRTSGFASLVDLSSLNGSAGFRFEGAEAGDRSGYSVSDAGDVDGDGFADVIIGAYGADPGGNSAAGSSYVVFGKAGGFASSVILSTLNGATGFRLDGVAASDRNGVSVSAAGDVNGDGFGEIMIGAYGADTNGATAGDSQGSSYVMFGKAGGFASAINPSTLDGASGFRLDGVAASDFSGGPVASAGDVNGDGLADMIVGAWRTDNSGSTAGSTYVVFGRAPVNSSIRVGSAVGQYISGGQFVDVLFGQAGNDVLEGRDSSDAMDGGTGSNTTSHAHAAAAVTVNLAGPSANTGEAEGDFYLNIQNIEGSGFADTLTGDGKPNRLTGGKGKDTKKGGNGKDTFAYRLSIESPPGAANADVIADFNPGTSSSVVDKIDLSAIDARTSVGGNQAFTFRGTKAFNGAGQVRLKKSGANVIVQGNTGGSTAPEFEIVLKGLASKIGRITIKDFKL